MAIKVIELANVPRSQNIPSHGYFLMVSESKVVKVDQDGLTNSVVTKVLGDHPDLGNLANKIAANEAAINKVKEDIQKDKNAIQTKTLYIPNSWTFEPGSNSSIITITVNAAWAEEGRDYVMYSACDQNATESNMKNYNKVYEMISSGVGISYNGSIKFRATSKRLPALGINVYLKG
jgi:hypothetical protein